MNEEMNRRATDKRVHNIEEMIAEENDPRQRSFLIVLNSINNSLLANTRTITEVSGKLDAHLTAFEAKSAEDTALLNKGRGAWKIIAWVLGIAQMGVFAAYVAITSDLKNIHQELVTGALNDARIEARIANLEKK